MVTVKQEPTPITKLIDGIYREKRTDAYRRHGGFRRTAQSVQIHAQIIVAIGAVGDWNSVVVGG